MKESLEEKMVSKVMGWTTAESTQGSHRLLRALAASGYDEYMQFSPGMRFVESMALWLRQFRQGERQAAHNFIVKRLLFVTRAQMEHAISIAYPDFVVPALVRQVADESSGRLPFWRVGEILASDEFRTLLAQCLFAGMSDGSHMDLFRRSSDEIDHEQVVRTHEVSCARARDLASALSSRIEKCGEHGRPPARRFRNVFLIDDFSASGKSYLRGSGKAEGKIARFWESISDPDDKMSELVDKKDLRIHVLLYAATDRAVDAILRAAHAMLPDMDLTVRAVHTIPSNIKLDEDRDSEFYRLVSQDKYGWSVPPDKHIRKGASEKPYLGFDHCALPLVLHHNTPNNSLPILHASERNFAGLFPRIRRHK